MGQEYKRKLGEILVSNGVMTEPQLNQALSKQKRTQTRLGETIVTLGMASKEQIAEAVRLQLDESCDELQRGDMFFPMSTVPYGMTMWVPPYWR